MISVLLCFSNNAFGGKEIAEMLFKDDLALGFTPQKVRSSSLGIKGEKYSRDRHLKMISNGKEDVKLSFESKEFTGPKFSISHPGIENAPQVFLWTLPEVAFEKLQIERLMLNNSFVVGYVYDQDFVYWQTESILNNYQYFKKPYDHLRQYWDDDVQLMRVDVSDNPGRMMLVRGMWLMAAWRMYFGEKFYQTIPKPQLMSFNQSYAINELSNNILMIQLYQNIKESMHDENLLKLQAFRKWTKMDEIINRVMS